MRYGARVAESGASTGARVAESGAGTDMRYDAMISDSNAGADAWCGATRQDNRARGHGHRLWHPSRSEINGIPPAFQCNLYQKRRRLLLIPRSLWLPTLLMQRFHQNPLPHSHRRCLLCVSVPDRLDTIFGAYEQVDASTTRKYGGTGMGLALVKTLVEAHHGSVSVASKHGQFRRLPSRWVVSVCRSRFSLGC